MKKTVSLLCAVLMAVTMAVPAFAYEVIGTVLSTDIRAYINGAEIPAYNIDGRLAIVVSDLNNYGFKTVYNNETRRSSVTRNPNANSGFVSVPSKASGLPIGARVMDVYRSDITVDLDGRVVPAVNVENRMAIYFSDLKGYGTYGYDNATRTSKITLAGSGPAVIDADPLKIVKAPADYKMKSESEAVSFTVQISGGRAPYTYRWFTEKGTSLTSESATILGTSHTYTVSFPESALVSTKSVYFYVEVTDANGARATSGKAVLTPPTYDAIRITKQPAAYQMRSDRDTSAAFTVEISGGRAPYTYKWIEEVDGNNGWSSSDSSSSTKNTFYEKDGQTLFRSYSTVKLYCEITDSNGYTIRSEKAELKPYAGAFKITSQPKDVTVTSTTSSASFSVTVTGGTAPYTYDWHLEEGRYTTPFTSYSTSSASDTLTLDSRDLSRWADSSSTLYIVCEITDANRTTIASDRAKLSYSASSSLSVVSQPRDYFMQSKQDNASFSVTVSGGKAPYYYDWYIIDGSRPTDYTTHSSSRTTDEITLDWIDLKDWYGSVDYVWVVCTVTDADDREVSTKKARLDFDYSSGGGSSSGSSLWIVEHPQDTRAVNGEAAFHIAVSGGRAPYKYEWTISLAGSPVGTETHTSSAEYDSFTLNSADTWKVFEDMVRVYCTVTDSNGETEVSANGMLY